MLRGLKQIRPCKPGSDNPYEFLSWNIWSKSFFFVFNAMENDTFAGKAFLCDAHGFNFFWWTLRASTWHMLKGTLDTSPPYIMFLPAELIFSNLKLASPGFNDLPKNRLLQWITMESYASDSDEFWNLFDDNNTPIWSTWAVGALSEMRQVFTSTAYVFTYLRQCGVETVHPRWQPLRDL